ncbi:MAG: hypothetical protein V1899_12835 [Planctomycetota bacterium]
MTETELEILLTRVATRLRMERAVRVALLTLGIGLLAAAAFVLWFRLQAISSDFLGVILASPPVAAIIALIVAFFHYRPASQQVAYLLDQRAASQERVVTWHELRQLPDATLNELQRGFRTAQRACTLRKTQDFNVRQLAPVSLPIWTRTLGLAFLLLCCALLVPPQTPESVAAGPTQEDIRRASPRLDSRSAVLTDGMSVEPRIQVISPTEKQRFLLLLTDSRLSPEIKAELLKSLAAKLGDALRSELPRELQEAWAAAEQEIAEKTGKDKTAEAGAAQSVTTTNPHEEKKAPSDISPAKIAEFTALALTTVHERYSDVENYLERYYKSQLATDGEKR